MIELETKTARQMTTAARLHPVLYQEVRLLAVKTGVNYTQMLERIVQVGIEELKKAA